MAYIPIGTDVLYNGEMYHVQDADCMQGIVLIGKVGWGGRKDLIDPDTLGWIPDDMVTRILTK